ncbi:hypothetical protein [Neorhizobium alkalisoli]|uniref:Uncharacterized protein n=1 Tax=Neorhizobium alkalisoli TaxID=528178 RepID=A0A561QAV5_9HYPH|nr:hypothetical protein [Neorhizobium alkalisoli]TWF47477.1 hypothetical protein FHW37_112116 [Neorhizobium alkalisoli]
MNRIVLAAICATAIGVAGQASAAQRHHSQPHKVVCHVEHHKVKVHGKWVIKQNKVCK